MKLAIVTVFGLFISLGAHATSATYNPSNVAQEGCSVLNVAEVEVQNDELTSAQISFQDGGLLNVKNLSHGVQCDSDIICRGFDTGSFKTKLGELVIVSFEHDNDRGYPTKLFGTFKNVTVTVGARSCVYEIVLD
jgi:hypothetical protein